MMLSQHFPSGYGHPLGWLVLVLVSVAGVVLKYVMNWRLRSDWRAVAAGAVSLLAAVLLTARPGTGRAAFGASTLGATTEVVTPLVALRAQHAALELLLGERGTADPTFEPSQHPASRAMQLGAEAIRKLESGR